MKIYKILVDRYDCDECPIFYMGELDCCNMECSGLVPNEKCLCEVVKDESDSI